MDLKRRKLLGLLSALFIALLIKYLYRSASVEDLRPVLMPTAWLLEGVFGHPFVFEAGQGYVSRALRFEIAAECAGLSFMVAAFLTFFTVFATRSDRIALGLAGALVSAVGATIVLNTVRICVALYVRSHPEWTFGLSSTDRHRLIGVTVYFGGLLLLFLVAHRLFDGRSESSHGRA